MPGATAQADTVVSRGVLGGPGVVVEYYTSQPAPTQWVAVGIAELRLLRSDEQALKKLLVGTGRSEAAAIQALRHRMPSTATHDVAAYRAPIDVVVGQGLIAELDARI